MLVRAAVLRRRKRAPKLTDEEKSNKRSVWFHTSCGAAGLLFTVLVLCAG